MESQTKRLVIQKETAENSGTQNEEKKASKSNTSQGISKTKRTGVAGSNESKKECKNIAERYKG